MLTISGTSSSPHQNFGIYYFYFSQIGQVVLQIRELLSGSQGVYNLSEWICKGLQHSKLFSMMSSPLKAVGHHSIISTYFFRQKKITINCKMSFIKELGESNSECLWCRILVVNGQLPFFYHQADKLLWKVLFWQWSAYTSILQTVYFHDTLRLHWLWLRWNHAFTSRLST